jgi:putative ABC transport system permease protein
MALVREHSAAAGYTLSQAVVAELAEYVHDVYADAREGGRSDAEALDAVRQVLARADYFDLSTCRRAEAPPPPERPSAPPDTGSSLRGIDVDVRDAWRRLLHQLPFSIAVASILALGIGASTAAYIVLDAVVLRPLPYPNPERLAVVRHVTSTGEGRAFATADWRDYQAQNGEVADLAASASWPMNLTGSGSPERLRSVIVSGNFFRVAGRDASLGRAIGEADDDPGAARVAVLSDRLWRRRFGAVPSIVGADIIVNGRPATVIGIMPPDFELPERDVDLWMPFAVPAAVLQDRRSEWVSLLARLQPGVDADRAQASLGATASALAESYPDTNDGDRLIVRSLAAQVIGDAGRAIWLSVAAALLVLLASCGNASHLMVVRAAGRREEMAIRASLGAAPSRLRRQLLVDSVLLTVAGGLLGVGAAVAFLRVFTALGDERIPRLEELAPDPVPLAVAALGSMALAIALTALAQRMVVRSALDGLPGSGARVVGRDEGTSLLAVQVAFAVTLASATAFVVGGYVATTRIDPGFDTANTLTMQLTLPRDRYPDSGAHAVFASRFSAALSDLPGVTGVGIVSDLPFVGNALHFAVTLQGLPAAGEQPMTVRPADAGYFRTLRVPLIEGRAFAETDNARAPLVAVLNRAAADRLDAATRQGRQLRIAGEPPRTIVGIVGDIRHEGLHADEGPVVYVPYSQKTFDFVNWMGVVLRGPGVERLGGEIRHVVARIDPDQPVQDIRTLDAYLEDERAPLELSALVIGALALSSALLALAGIYAMTAFVVGRRTPEIGVRIALGASKGSILGLVLARAGLPIGSGIFLGIGGGFAAAAMLRTLVVTPEAPVVATVIACAGLLAASALAAALQPALRATRVDPKASLEN